ncbi:MAG TPA: DUF2254 domain-containing protein [Usitatibacter sp.]|nr:DUF2254 domain-containing protein [Usitatibacter sp.]
MSTPATGHRPGPGARLLARWRRLERRVRGEITWNRIYRATSYVKSALWVVPLVAIVLDLAFAPVLRELDRALGWKLTGLDEAGATALFQTVITLTLSFLVFTFGSLLVAIQVAGGQLTPRIIATTLLRDNVVRYSVGLFVFTLVLTVTALNRVTVSVHQIVVVVVAVLGIACMATFLFLIDYAARLLRPVSILSRVGEEGLKVIDAVYPETVGGLGGDTAAPWAAPGAPARTMSHEGSSEIVLAVDLATLVAEARRRDGVIELAPQVGDFLAFGEPLFHLYGGAAAVPNRKLEAAVALGPERTLEQDPMFAFRILVDIALKALSPAINDPTTAVLALDQVHRLLRIVGRRQLRAEAIRDPAGAVRVIFRTPNWEDFVHIACTEVRACGASSVQVARRLRAMLVDLLRLLPAHRHPSLRTELELLDRTLEVHYREPEDLALARIPDVQGLGGSTRGQPGAAP